MSDVGLVLPESIERSGLPDLSGYPSGRPPDTDRILRAVLREWRTSLLFLMSAVLLGAIYILVSPRYYTSSAIVMAAPRQPDLSRTDSVLNGTTTPEPVIVRDPDIEGEIQIMSASAAVRRVVRDLALDNPANQGITDHPSIYDLMQEFRVIVGLEQATPAHPATLSDLGQQILQRVGLGSNSAVAPSDDLNRRTALAGEMVARNLKVAPIGRSTMVKIDFTSRDPEVAAQVPTAIANHYIEARNQIRVDAASEAGVWLRSHTAKLRDELIEAEKRLASFRSTAHIDGRDPVQIDGDMKVLGDRIMAAKAEQAKASSRLAVAEDRVRQDGPLGLLSWDVLPGADEFLTQARAIAEMHKEAAKLSAVSGSFNPNVQRIEIEAKVLESKLNREAETRLRNLRMTADAAAQEVGSLEATLRSKRDDYDRLDALSVQLSALQEAAAAARTVYQNFETRWKTTEQTGFNEAKGWLVSPAAVPVRPSWPSIPMVLIGSVVAGTGMGISGALFREYRGRRTFRSNEDVERLLPGIRSLGLMPEVRSAKKSIHNIVAVAGTQLQPEFDEAMANIWTSLCQTFAQPRPTIDAPPAVDVQPAADNHERRHQGHVVLVSSALPKEGKSAATASIACAASAAGYRVVVVDCDLRLPTINKAFAVAAYPGLSEYVEQSADYHTAVTTNRSKQVSVLPAGGSRQPPQQTLRSPRFADMLAHLRTDFDLILIDSPPVLGLADARVLGELADHTVLVAAWSKTAWKAVALALQTLHRHRHIVAGVLLTRVDMRRVARFGSVEAEPFRFKYRDYYRGYRVTQGSLSAAQTRIVGPFG